MKDGPKSGRMGFGYQQHRDAGVPFRAPPSVADQKARDFIAKYPQVKDYVERRRADGARVDTILSELREDGVEGPYCIECWYDGGRERLAERTYGADQVRLESRADSMFRLGAYKAAVLWEMEEESRDWIEIREWPEGYSDDA